MAEDLTDAMPPEEDAQPFTYNDPEPESEPEPVAEPVAAEETVVPEPDTSWLDGLGALPPEPPQQQQQYPQPPPYYQQPQPPPQSQGYGNDVDAYIDARARQISEQALRQNLGPVAMQLQQFQAMTNAQMSAVADTELSRARTTTQQAVRNNLSKDKGYRENESVRNTVNENISQWINGAYASARQGDPRQLLMVQDPNFFSGVLALSKIKCGYQPNAVGPAQPRGAVVESATPPQQQASVELPGDLELIAQKMGPSYRKKLEREFAVTKKAADLDMWD